MIPGNSRQCTNVIADIYINTHWQQDFPLRPHLPQYIDFNTSKLQPPPRYNCIDLELIADTPPPEVGQAVFSTDSWILYNSYKSYSIHWGHPDYKIPWERQVVASLDFKTVKLYYSSDCYKHSSELLSPIRLAHYPVDLFLLTNLLADNEGTIIHSAGGNILGKGIIFPGVSGAGKSTLSRLLKQVEGTQLFTDDRMIIKNDNGRWVGYGTPWSGDALIAENKKINLDALIFITQAKKVKISPVSPGWALRRLLQVCSIPWYNPERMQRSLDLCERLIAQVPMYECQFANNPQAARQICEMIGSL